MTRLPDTAVLIPSAKGRAHLEVLLPTLRSQTLAPAEILIADAEEDGSRDLAEEFGARFLPLRANLGFAYAVNRLIEATTAPCVAVLNNDLRLSSDWLATLRPHLDTQPFAVGKLCHWDQPGLLDGSWDELSLSGLPIRTGHGKKDSFFFNQPKEISFAPWTAILLRRDYLQAVGQLDESFGSYFEDVDYGLRSLELGYSGIYDPLAVCWHRGSATFGAWHPRQVELSARNQLLLVAKHGGLSWCRRWPKEFWCGQLLSALAAYRHGSLRPWLRGKKSGWAALRRSSRELCSPLAEKLEARQQGLFRASHEGGLDPFWRYYWALTL